MARVKSKDTAPERIVRQITFGLGFRYRLHGAKLPGKPDLVFASRRKVIFVHGCFWHRHKGCKLARLPKSRLSFWKPKLEGNKKRDAGNLGELRQLDWKVLLIWECQLRDTARVTAVIKRFLGSGDGAR